VTIVACSVLGPVSLALGAGRPHMQPSRFWGAGLVALAGGLALIGLRGHAPDFVWEVVGQGLVALALMFAQASARTTNNEPGRDVFGWALFALLILALIIAQQTSAAAWVSQPIGSGMMGCMACRVAQSFDCGKEQRERYPLRMIGVIFGLFGLALILHAALELARPVAGDASEPEIAGALMLVGLVAGVLLGTALLLWVMTERMHDRLRQFAALDPLTGVLNRLAFVEHFEREVSRSRRRAESFFGLLLVNIDHFRRINDAYGQAAGDRLLVTIAEILRRVIRRYDLLGRLEGDVFVLLMLGAQGESVSAMGERVRSEIEHQANVHAGLKNHVTVSIGGALFGEHGEDWSTMLRAAETAAVDAKARGRNRVKIAAPMPRAVAPVSGEIATGA